MTKPRPTSTGDAITTFTFLLFGVLLSLASMIEPIAWKAIAIGFCAAFSFAGALRFRLQHWFEIWRSGR